ncbi:F-box/FBD/LRR-repeat protein At1g13570-like [Rutidosis leptorrhynchoides]|uniref:F-box/FBD/LRR-repeat protein At1g13570-like n=1 Tax=Rutidosis leptorrhynchoides TaxID=125765 RepID=UPI003A99ADA9
MELAAGTHEASKVVLEDVINSMPDNVVTNILDRLPIQYAVRTSILSKKWRFKWTMLTHLVLDNKFYEYLLRLGIGNWYNVSNISILLLHLKGPITKFVLYIPNDKIFDVGAVNNWIVFLSRNGVKELTLKNMHETRLKLSTHIFSCELERLMLRSCSISSPPTFCGLPNLLCLELRRVTFESGSLGEFITQSSLLEILRIGRLYRIGKIKLVEIAKLKNLKELFLPLCLLDHRAITSCLIVDLGSCLLNLEVLYLNFQNSQFIEDSVGRNRVSTSFPCLKRLALHEIDISSKINLLFAFELIQNSPKLQALGITAKDNDVVPPPANFLSELNSTTTECGVTFFSRFGE